MNTIEQKRTTYNKWFKVGGVALAALIVAPIIFFVIKGLVGLLIAAVIGLVAVNLVPLLAMKMANWKVKGIVSEAKENPIETMINLLIAKKEAFQLFKDDVETATTGYKTFERKIEEFSKQYPARAKEFMIQLKAMGTLVTQKQQALKQAQAAIREGDDKLNEMKAFWEMSQIAQAANKSAGMDTGDLFEKLKAETACDSVFESMNRAFAEMEVASQLSTPMQLENNASQTLNTYVIDGSKVKVST